MTVYRSAYRYRTPYRRRRRANRRGQLVAVVTGALIAYKAGIIPHHAQTAVRNPQHHQQQTQVTDVTGSSETAFWTAVLADLGVPVTPADLRSLTAWAGNEGPWGTVGRYNPLDSILPMPGSSAFNTFYSGGAVYHVQNYPTPSEGALATARTIAGYPSIVAALRTRAGLCGSSLALDFSRWSGGGYTEVC